VRPGPRRPPPAGGWRDPGSRPSRRPWIGGAARPRRGRRPRSRRSLDDDELPVGELDLEAPVGQRIAGKTQVGVEAPEAETGGAPVLAPDADGAEPTDLHQRTRLADPKPLQRAEQGLDPTANPPQGLGGERQSGRRRGERGSGAREGAPPLRVLDGCGRALLDHHRGGPVRDHGAPPGAQIRAPRAGRPRACRGSG
jgi:hypothetical protein